MLPWDTPDSTGSTSEMELLICTHFFLSKKISIKPFPGTITWLVNHYGEQNHILFLLSR